MDDSLFIGLDFGSDSVRAVLIDSHGAQLQSSVMEYPRWKQGLYSDTVKSQFRQHPLDYLESMECVIRAVVSGCDVKRIRGIGADTTGSTPCAVDAEGVPLALHPEFADHPSAMFFLWKDHCALTEASEITEHAKHSPVDYTRYEGGSYSAEWFWAKYLYILRNNPEIRKACRGFVEHCDWIPAELTGRGIKASRCAAGHKAMWHKDWGGLPPEEFLTGIDPLLAGRRSALYRETYPADQPVGPLSEKWAERLGLHTGVTVSVGGIDCHVGAVGAGIKPGCMVMVTGTSTCNIIVTPELDRCIGGICGQVDGSVLPGMVGLEAGQAAFGDIYAWFARLLSYGAPVELSRLEADAAALPPSGTIVLDWWNGRRTPNPNQNLSGVIAGLNLGTSAPALYRSLVEGTACGAKRITAHFKKEGIAVEKIIAVGGVARKSPFVMQVCADVLDMPIRVAKTDQACALGAAMFAAVASGVYPDISEAMKNMESGYDREYKPVKANVKYYERQYARYLELSDAIEFKNL